MLFEANDAPQRKALEETKAIFPQLRQKIQDARTKLEQQLVSVISNPPPCFRSC